MITFPNRVTTRPGLDSLWLGSIGLVITVSGFSHLESSLPSYSILSSTVGTEIISDLWNISLLSLYGICQIAPGLRDASCKSKVNSLLTHLVQPFAHSPMPLVSSGIKWLSCTKRRSLLKPRTRQVLRPFTATIVPGIHFSFPRKVCFTLTGWYKSKTRPLGWSPSLYNLDASCFTCLCKPGFTKERCILGSLFKSCVWILSVVECGGFL